jgi:hypothetical protein
LIFQSIFATYRVLLGVDITAMVVVVVEGEDAMAGLLPMF